MIFLKAKNLMRKYQDKKQKIKKKYLEFKKEMNIRHFKFHKILKNQQKKLKFKLIQVLMFIIFITKKVIV